MIAFKNKNRDEINAALSAAGLTLTFDALNGEINCNHSALAQAIIDALPEPMPNLDPVQFGYLLARYKFKDVIIQLLENIRVDDEEKYAIYDAYLSRSKYYEFTRALAMFNEIREKFTTIDSSLNFTDEQLKQMWLAASEV